jgi:type I restriction enzyme S subunit
MQPYSYRDSGIEWLGKIPVHWKIKRLKSIAGLRDEKTNEKSSECDYVELEDIEQGTGRLLGRRNTLEVASAVNLFRSGDVLFGKLRPYLEKYHHADFDGKCTGEILAIEPQRIDGGFLTYYVGSAAFINHCSNFAYGVKMPRVNWNTQMAYFPIPVPSREEQRAIAGFLDRACGKIDAAIQVKREQLAMLDVMAKAILNKAVLEGLNPNVSKQQMDSIWFKALPTHWQLRRLKDVSTMQTGVTLGKDYDGETDERPYLRVANVQDGHLALDDVKTIKLPPHLIRRYELQAGDVLMNEGGDLDKLGRGHVWQGEIPGCLHQNHVFALRCFPHKLLPDYLTLLTSSTHGRAYFEIMGKKTTNLASINSTKVNLFPVPLPLVTEQAQIVQWVQQERGKLKQMQAVVSQQIAVLEAYKKALVHECVTGKKQVWRGDWQMMMYILLS